MCKTQNLPGAVDPVLNYSTGHRFRKNTAFQLPQSALLQLQASGTHYELTPVDSFSTEKLQEAYHRNEDFEGTC